MVASEAFLTEFSFLLPPKVFPSEGAKSEDGAKPGDRLHFEGVRSYLGEPQKGISKLITSPSRKLWYVCTLNSFFSTF